MLKYFNRVVVFLFSSLFMINSFAGALPSTNLLSLDSVSSSIVESSASNTDEIQSDSSDGSLTSPATSDESTDEAVVSSESTQSESSVVSDEISSKSSTKSTTKTASLSSGTSVVKSIPTSTPVVKTAFSSSKSDIYINYSSAAEELIAKNLVNGNTSFSIDGCSSIYPYDALVDTFKKVVCQNPYILGIISYTYSEVTHMVNVNYVYDAQTIKSKQNAINSSANKIINNTIGGNMSDEEKRLAIYDYLQSNTSYNDDAASYASANGFVKTGSTSYEDCFNTYGIIVNKNGVCMSYAYAFKLLCDMAGVTCTYATGALNGTPHMWNLVKIDGSWYHVDPTNNKNVCGIPYKIYNAPQGLANSNGYVLDGDFALDSEISSYKIGSSYNYEFYSRNSLVADSFDEYKTILTNNLRDGKTCVFVRLNATYDRTTFTNIVKDVFTNLGMSSKLNNAQGKQSGQYLVVSY